MAVYGDARSRAVSGNWLKLDNGDAFEGAIVDVSGTRMVHHDAKPPTPAQPSGQPASDNEHMVFHVYCETVTRLGGAVEVVNDFMSFEPQIKWCNGLFDVIDGLERTEGNAQAIYGHRVKIQRVDKRSARGFLMGNLVAHDLGKIPAGHAASSAPAGAAAPAPAATPAPVIPRPAGVPAPGAVSALESFRAGAANLTTLDQLKNALRVAWPSLKDTPDANRATVEVYGPRKQAILLRSLQVAADVDALTVAWSVAFAETEKDPAMRAIVEAACAERNGALSGAAPAVAEDDIPF